MQISLGKVEKLETLDGPVIDDLYGNPFALAAFFIRRRRNQSDRWIVCPLLALVRVLLDGLFLGVAGGLFCFRLRHQSLPRSKRLAVCR